MCFHLHEISFFTPLLSGCVSFDLKWVSCRRHAPCFLIHSATLSFTQSSNIKVIINRSVVITIFFLKNFFSPGWYGSVLSADLGTKGSLVSQVRAHAWVVGQVPSRGCLRSNHTLIFLFPLPLPSLSKKK